jgi:hypothetical protein
MLSGPVETRVVQLIFAHLSLPSNQVVVRQVAKHHLEKLILRVRLHHWLR